MTKDTKLKGKEISVVNQLIIAIIFICGQDAKDNLKLLRL